MLMLFHASPILAQPSFLKIFVQFHFVFSRGRDLSPFPRISYCLLKFQDEGGLWGHSHQSLTSLTNGSEEKIEEKAAYQPLLNSSEHPIARPLKGFKLVNSQTSNLKQPRRMWIGQRDSGLKGWGAVELLRATDSLTRSHSSGWTLLQSLAPKTFVEKSFQYCQLPKLGLHGKLWDWRNLLHFVSVQLEGTNNPHYSCLKHLFDNNDPIQGGNSDGSCAAGFGTCCTFSAPCDSETTQNGTYFSRW